MRKRVKDIVLAPLEDGNQKYAIRSNADVVAFTGATGGGKSYTLYYAPIEYLSVNDNAKIVCFMRNISDFFASGKVVDTLKQMYPLIDRSSSKQRQPHDPIGEIRRNETDMGMKLYNGSEIKFQQLDNESPLVIDKLAKGLQAKILIFDECNKFLWRTISSFFPRLRSDSAGKAQVYLAQNPERECFMRKMCGKGKHGGGWINDDGTIDKDKINEQAEREAELADREYLKNMAASSSQILMDETQNMFYVVRKDANGNPFPITVGKFTVETEPPEDSPYISKQDFEAFKAELWAKLGEKGATA